MNNKLKISYMKLKTLIKIQMEKYIQEKLSIHKKLINQIIKSKIIKLLKKWTNNYFKKIIR